MRERVRCNLYFPPAVVAAADRLAKKKSLSRTALFIRALGVLDALEAETDLGRHVGGTPHRDRLETVLISPTI